MAKSRLYAATPSVLLASLALASAQQHITGAHDAGGGRSTGGAITNDAALGGIGGVHDDAPGTISRPGFAGQLYDAVRLTVQPSPAEVAENSTRSFTAVAVCEDATTVPITSVLWDHGGSPFFTVSPAGVVTASAVPADMSETLGLRSGEIGGTVPLTIYDSDLDNYGPFAGDGLSDAWQWAYFANNPASGAPGSDPDGDGQDNAFEFLAGTTPLDGSSFLRLRIEAVPGNPNSRRLFFGPWRPDRSYQWQFSLDLRTPWQPLLDAPVSLGPNNEGEATDAVADAASKFYRLRIQ